MLWLKQALAEFIWKQEEDDLGVILVTCAVAVINTLFNKERDSRKDLFGSQLEGTVHHAGNMKVVGI